MNALERLNFTKELRQLVDTIPDMKGMDKLQSTKRLRELIEILGGQATSEVNKLYQSIIDGREEREASVELLLQVRARGRKKPARSLLIDAVKCIDYLVNELAGTTE